MRSILVIAGGGGGVEPGSSVFDGVTTQNGGSNGSVNGGTNGSGGQNDHGHGGSGFFTSPTGSTGHGGTFPLPYVNGGVGGLNSYNGGFGGGGAGAGVATGGGGGYSGGASGGDHSGTGGGGGGSFNSGTNQLNQAGANAGHGKVIISALNTPPTLIFLFPIIACRKIYPPIHRWEPFQPPIRMIPMERVLTLTRWLRVLEIPIMHSSIWTLMVP